MGKKRKAASMAPLEFTKGPPVAVPVSVSGDVCVQWPGFVVVSKPGYVMVKFHGENGLYRYLPNEVIILTLDNYLNLEKKGLDYLGKIKSKDVRNFKRSFDRVKQILKPNDDKNCDETQQKEPGHAAAHSSGYLVVNPKTDTSQQSLFERLNERRKQNRKYVDCMKGSDIKKYLLGLPTKSGCSSVSGFGPIVEDDLQEEVTKILGSYCTRNDQEARNHLFEVWIPEAVIQAIKTVHGTDYEKALKLFSECTIQPEELVAVHEEIITSAKAHKEIRVPAATHKVITASTCQNEETEKPSQEEAVLQIFIGNQDDGLKESMIIVEDSNQPENGLKLANEEDESVQMLTTDDHKSHPKQPEIEQMLTTEDDDLHPKQSESVQTLSTDNDDWHPTQPESVQPEIEQMLTTEDDDLHLKQSESVQTLSTDNDDWHPKQPETEIEQTLSTEDDNLHPKQSKRVQTLTTDNDDSHPKKPEILQTLTTKDDDSHPKQPGSVQTLTTDYDDLHLKQLEIVQTLTTKDDDSHPKQPESVQMLTTDDNSTHPKQPESELILANEDSHPNESITQILSGLWPAAKTRKKRTRKTVTYVFDSSDEHDSVKSVSDTADKLYVPETDTSDSDNDLLDSTGQVTKHRKEPESEQMVTTESSENLVECDTDAESDASEIIPVMDIKDCQSNSDSESDCEDINNVVKDVNNPKIYYIAVNFSEITKAGKPKLNARVANSYQACPFGCRKLYRNFAQHILRNDLHMKEAKVKEINKIIVSHCDSSSDKKLKSRERKRLLTLLRLRGNHLHNQRVLKRGRGQVFLSRRQQAESFNVEMYGPCPNCLDWILKRCMYRHQKSCPARDNYINSCGSLLTQSDVLSGRIEHSPSQALLKEVFPMMKVDEISKIAKGDDLIICLGNDWMKKNIGNPLMRKYYTSAKMRLMARVKKHLLDNSKDTNSAEMTLDHFLAPKHFDDVVKASLNCARQSAHDEEELDSPSNAIKLGYDLKRVSSIKLANAITTNDGEKRREAKDFLKLMNLKWSNKLATVALATKRRMKKVELPLPEDIQKLSTYLKNACLSFDTNKETVTYSQFREGVLFSLARLVTFNRRRNGEVQAMLLENYAMRTTEISEVSSELRGQMTELEWKLLESQDCIMVKGKSSERTGKDVPVVVPKDVRGILLYLADKEVRRSAGINFANPYIFANNRAGVIRAYDAVALVAERANLKHPERIRSTNLRKYMATMTQSFDITHQQFQWVLDHLGHTESVHREHYRSMSDVIERVDIAKLLLIQDNGLVGRYHGKKLEEITLEELVYSSQEQSEQSESELSEQSEKLVSEQPEPDLEEDCIPDLPVDLDYDIFQEEDVAEVKKKKKQMKERHKWTDEEITELHEIFHGFIAAGKTPRIKDLEKGLKKSKAKNGHLWRLRRDNVKKKVSWIICRARKD